METGGLIEQILPFLGCRFIAIADHFDSMAADANEGRLVMNLKNLVNDMYAKDISNRVTAARRMSAQRGSFTGSFAPYGYDVVRVQGIRKLQMNEECAKVVRKIFTLYAQGAAVKEIITRLYAEQVHRISDYKKYGHVYCRNGEELHQWSEGAISGMLQNRSYLGSLHRDISYVKQREQITEGNTHEAIISRELFELVQERSPGSRQVRKKSYRQRSTENVYRHILYCGCCGKAMRAAYHQSRIKDERHYAYYCRRTYLVDGRKCEKNYITEEKLTELCLEQIRSMFSGQQVKAGDLTGLNQAEYDRKMAEYMLEERKIADECERLKKHAGILYGQYKAGMIARDEYELFRRRKRRQEELAEKSLEEIRQKRRQAGSSVQEEKDFLCSLLKGDTGIKPDILFIEAMHEKISIFPDGVVDITYRFQGEDRV